MSTIPAEPPPASRRRRWPWLALSLVTSLGVGFLQQSASYRRARAELDAVLADRRQRVQELEKLAATLDEFKHDVMSLEVRSLHQSQSLPPSLELDTLADRVVECAEAARLTVRRLDIDPPVKRDSYQEALLSAAVSGTDAAIQAWLGDVRAGRCLDPLYSPHRGAPVRHVDVLGPASGGSEHEVGFLAYAAESPRLAPVAHPTRSGWHILWPPFARALDEAAREQAGLEQRLMQLQVIEHQLEAYEEKRRTVSAVSEILSRLEAATPGEKDGLAMLGDRHLEAGRLRPAVAAYRAALPAPDGIVAGTGFFLGGRVYVRELGPIYDHQTAQLIGIDTARGVVVERYRLPGHVTSFRRVGESVEVACSSPGDPPHVETLRFSRAGFDRPLFFGPDARARSALQWISSNVGSRFLDTLLEKTGPGEAPKFPAAGERIFGRPARSLEEVTAALSEATRLDPTQPWHAFFRGAALWGVGRTAEAEKPWERLFGADFGGVAYYEFTGFAYYFERLGLRPWADRAYQRALEARRKLPFPIDFTTFVGRSTSARFLSAAVMASQKGFDLERQHLWWERARELTGISLWQDEPVAAIWEEYFRSRGDVPKAEREREFRDRALRHPLNPQSACADLEHALAALAATSVGLWGLLLGCLVSAWRPGAQSRDRGVRPALRAAADALQARARPVLGLALLLAVASAAWYVRAADRGLVLATLPYRLTGDSLASFALEMDELVRAAATPERRYAAAVLHHWAGDAGRARELYQSLGDDPRARDNLAALDRGVLVPQRRLTADDLRRAFLSAPWSERVRRVLRLAREFQSWLLFPGLSEYGLPDKLSVFFRARLLDAAALAVVATLLLCPTLGVVLSRLAPGSERTPAERPVSKALRIAYVLVPGALDLRLGRPARAYAALTLSAFAALVLVFFDPAAPGGGLLTPHLSSSGEPGGVPLPPAPHIHWTFFWAYPGARPFWSSVALALILAVALHLSTLRSLSSLPQAPPPPPTALPRRLALAGWSLLCAQGAAVLIFVVGLKLAIALTLAGIDWRASAALFFWTGVVLAGAALALTPIWLLAAAVMLVRRRGRGLRTSWSDRSLLAALTGEIVALAAAVIAS